MEVGEDGEGGDGEHGQRLLEERAVVEQGVDGGDRGIDDVDLQGAESEEKCDPLRGPLAAQEEVEGEEEEEGAEDLVVDGTPAERRGESDVGDPD